MAVNTEQSQELDEKYSTRWRLRKDERLRLVMTLVFVLIAMILGTFKTSWTPQDIETKPYEVCREGVIRKPSGSLRCVQGEGREVRGEYVHGPDALIMGIPLNLNRVGAQGLQLIPGIGPKLAQKIVRDRREQGPFASVRDLERIRGIGHQTAGRLSRYLRVAGSPRDQ